MFEDKIIVINALSCALHACSDMSRITYVNEGQMFAVPAAPDAAACGNRIAKMLADECERLVGKA